MAAEPYVKQEWIDHIEDSSGAVIQQGTSMDAVHFNHMEDGIYNASTSAGVQEVVFFFDDDGYLNYRKADEDSGDEAEPTGAK